MRSRFVFAFAVLLLGRALPAATIDPAAIGAVDRIFADWALDAHVPGLIYGIVRDGRMIHVRGLGVQDREDGRPVTADSLFRIASMSKAFTALAILKLRDEGRLVLDAPAEDYVPELKAWRYPTSDSPRITVRNLLTHSAGLSRTIRGAIASRCCPRRTLPPCSARGRRSRVRRGWAWNIRTMAMRSSAAS